MLIEIFLKTVNMSIGAMPLMLAMLLLRLLFKKSVPRKVFYFAWILVFLRLMVPISFESNLSFFNFLPESYVTEAPIGTSIEFVENRGETLDFPVLQHPSEDNPNVDGAVSEVNPGESNGGETAQMPNAPLKEENTPTVTRSPIEKNLVFSTAWFFGTGALLSFGILGYAMVLRKIKKESVPYANNIVLCDFFTTPMVCGFIKPKIILPLTFNFDDEVKVKSVLSHENIHIKRLDNLRRLLASFTLYVHWFNPVVWICYWAFIRDMEVSCDEEVLQKSRADIRSDYAESLVALAGNGTNPLYGGVLSFGETAIKERVKCIMNFKKAKLFIVIICVAVAAALGLIFLTNPAVPSAENAVEIISHTFGEFTYNAVDDITFSIEIKNNSGKNLYIDNTAKIEKYDEATSKYWEMDEMAGPTTGMTVIAPGETVSIKEVLTPYFVHVQLNPEGGKYIFKYGVYADVGKTNFIQDIEYAFSVTKESAVNEAETEPNDYAFVASQYEFLPESAPVHEGDDFSGKEKFGDKEKAEYFEKLISGANTSVITEFCAISLPYEGKIYTSIEKEEIDEFLSYLKRVQLLPGKEGNPSTGGALYIYIKYDDEAFTLRYDGRVSFAENGYIPATVFCLDAEGEKLFAKMMNLADEILVNSVKKENANLGFTGVITTKDSFVSPVPIPVEKAVGTADDGRNVTEAINSVTENNIIGMYVFPFAENSQYEVPLTKEKAMRIVDLLKGVGLDLLTEVPNPNMAGGVAVYIETKDTAFAVNYSGGMITFSQKGRDKSYVFGDSLSHKVFAAISSIVSEATENTFQTAAPAEGTFLPDIMEIDSVTIFNNTEKLCVPAVSNTGDPTGELYNIIKYSNFTNYGMEHEVSETELTPLTGVDAVEFSRVDGKKYTLKLYETGFVLSGSAVDTDEKRVWLVEKEVWDKFKKIARECYSGWSEKHPSWLGLLNFNNVVGAEVEFNGESSEKYTAEDSCLINLLSEVKYVRVAGPGKKVDPTIFQRYGDNHLSVHIEFRTGVVYTVYFEKNETKFKLCSSDMSYALEYEVAPESNNYYSILKAYSVYDSTAEANPMTAKPVIYLYPEKERDISVNLNFNGKLTYTYPALNSGWEVTAKPDGSLVNKAGGSLHRYLFWEGIANYTWSIEKGFVVSGTDTEKFLVGTLTKMGLNQYEIADFVTYWVPRMIENEYNLISFSGNEYAEVAKLTVNPKPDSLIRVHMVWKALDAPVSVQPQALPTYERYGFTLVEWGGTEIK